MVTLTLPGAWLEVAPDGKTFKTLLDKFRKRWGRAWGMPPRWVWKMEFQRRGAPHFHLFTAVPNSLSKNGISFSEWVSRTWADVVNHPDKEQYRRHLLAGTGVDYAEGLKAMDPQRLAVYFSKHGSAGAAGSKEYQNRPPSEWSGSSVGRFWGYVGLEKLIAIADVTEENALRVSRTLRRWHRSKGLTKKCSVWRSVGVDRVTGEVKYRKRTVTRRTERFPTASGFITANDGPSLLTVVSKILE
ncbi:rolling circle replication-associated protein [Arthrobacter sp. CAN_A212]|uniref:rolling circle replication-associated protein n=1 Tax=Arthrobacter sp. CAN_A212 TaxID=2787719 RepID=UPI003FA47B89